MQRGCNAARRRGLMPPGALNWTLRASSRTRSQHGGNAQEAHSSSASSSATVVIAEGSDVGHDM
jgi:hypothetical protein